MLIEKATSPSYYQQSYGQVEACIKFEKHTLNKFADTNDDPHKALLQIRSTQLGQGLSSPRTLLINHTIRGIMPILNRPQIITNNDDDHYRMLVERQAKAYKNHDSLRGHYSIPIGLL